MADIMLFLFNDGALQCQVSLPRTNQMISEPPTLVVE